MADRLAAKRKLPEADLALAKRPEASAASSPGASPDRAEKKRRVIGPSLPPTAIERDPAEGSENDAASSSSSEDEFGPAMPVAGAAASQGQLDRTAEELEEKTKAAGPVRPQWMLEPPKQDDWSSRVDPTKLRNRKFNTGMGAKAPAQKSNGSSLLWTETPEQKRQRLADEVMGVRKPATEGDSDAQAPKDTKKEDATTKRIQEYNERYRSQSLYEERKRAAPREEGDDPSARAFDKEKDIGGGRQVSHTQKKELLRRAADFGSRFAGGNYL